MFAGLRGAVCQWHTFSTDRSEYEDTKYGTIRKASFDSNIFMKMPTDCSVLCTFEILHYHIIR